MIDTEDILMTGSEGRLGTQFKKLLPGVICPTEAEMDITDPAIIAATLDKYSPKAILHCAAYTDVKNAESKRQACWAVNVDGTHNLVRQAIDRDLRFIHISTDYVFYGDKGNYSEADTPGPVRNYYALTKLVAEQLVRLSKRHLVLRTSFRPSKWPYPVAFDDIYTSQDYVDIIAPMLSWAIERADEIDFDTLHIATGRKSVYDLASSRKADVQRGQKAAAGVDLPDDISLDCTRYNELRKNWK